VVPNILNVFYAADKYRSKSWIGEFIHISQGCLR
jgi:hypothetical protein